MSFEYFIGGRYLRSKHKQAFISFITFLSMAGVTVGVMALIIVIAVMSGAESYFTTQILGVESHVIVRRHGSTISNYQDIIKKVKSRERVVSAAPFVYTQVMLRSATGISGAVLRGIDPASGDDPIKGFSKADLIEKIRPQQVAGEMAKDSAADSAKAPGIVLGKELAMSLGVSEGESLYLISPKGMMSPIGQMPSMKRFEVTGIFESGFYEYDASLVFVHLKTAQKMIKIGDSVSGIGVRIDDIYQARQVSESIVSELGFPFWTTDWVEMNRNFFSALKLEKKAMFVILTLIIMVAAFNIASTLIMMVMGKTQDIAILKAMGATDRSIWKIFVFNGTIIGLIGTGMGVILGILSCFVLKHYKFIELPGDVYYFTSLPIQLEFLDVFAIIIAAMGICFLSTLYPAYKASKMNPVEALRYG